MLTLSQTALARPAPDEVMTVDASAPENGSAILKNIRL
jgi:hypothetical protein